MPFPVIASPLLGAAYYDELISSVDNARSSILVVQYQWKWNVHERRSRVQCLGASVIRARARGLDVRVILNNESPMRNLSKINRVTGNALGNAGCLIKNLRSVSLVHTKLWIIDGVLTFLGSHNISTRSLTVNEETSVKIESRDFAKYMQKYFENLWVS